MPSFFLFKFPLYHLSSFQEIREIIWTTYRNTGTVGRTSLTCSQQSAGASSEDKTRQKMGKGEWKTLSVHIVRQFSYKEVSLGRAGNRTQYYLIRNSEPNGWTSFPFYKKIQVVSNRKNIVGNCMEFSVLSHFLNKLKKVSFPLQKNTSFRDNFLMRNQNDGII